VRLRGDHHGVGRCHRLQACGEVGRLAHHRLFLARSFADDVTDHHESRGDADPYLHRLAQAVVHRRRCLHYGERRAYRALRVVLVRAWVAEVRENAVTQILRDHPLEAHYEVGASGLVPPDDFAEIFRIESPARGGADESQNSTVMAALGSQGRRRSCRGVALSVTLLQCVDRLQQLLAVTERNAQRL
jgi:hypothetical protein